MSAIERRQVRDRLPHEVNIRRPKTKRLLGRAVRSCGDNTYRRELALTLRRKTKTRPADARSLRGPVLVPDDLRAIEVGRKTLDAYGNGSIFLGELRAHPERKPRRAKAGRNADGTVDLGEGIR